MAIFVSRDKYFTFTENTREQNAVNKLTMEVATVLASSQEDIFLTSQKYNPTMDYSSTAPDENYEIPEKYPIKNLSFTPVTITYQSSYSELNKYDGIKYRVKGRKISSTRIITTTYDWFGNSRDTVSVDDSGSFKVLAEDEEFASGVCSIDDNFLCSMVISGGPEVQLYSVNYENGSILGIEYKKARIETGEYIYYDRVYVELYAINKDIDYSKTFKFAESNQKILFNTNIDQNSFIQNATNYNGTPISDYIADTVFKNYEHGRPVATLEWIGSPEVDYGTELIIEPRREYNEEDLITYVVMGKKITYTGGYRETLYLTKKEAD